MSTGTGTFAATLRGVAGRVGRTFPGRDDPRCEGTTLFPSFTPKFSQTFDRGVTVFTIGSCFARNIEEALKPLHVILPTRDFAVPKSEWTGRLNGLLNEYNPGTMAQRIRHALSAPPEPEATIVPMGEGVVDLLLPGAKVVSRQRAVARRAEIAAVYARLRDSDLVVMTLGLAECWYDTMAGVYLNRMPPPAHAAAHPNRYEFRRLDVQQTVDLLEPALAALGELRIRTVLTVSPVPLQSTFTAEDCVVANEISKATLRVAADRLQRGVDHVDYFPSYEIVRSGGLGSYNPDNVHVRDDLVKQITSRMVSLYASPPEAPGI